ncbi:YugN-like family protein [Seinonella peptonophila]|uniref:YugN-like family protein n=1 Tax=Seinonella peptonophila TaxID=112248 RepID=A0A1M4VRG5_9BACL|nr:YugN family protein [Seinonella peptonophila]SHE71616.1 YugN-like family protein [Seinonella peptonophila]
MITLDSKVENHQDHFHTISKQLKKLGFVLGGGYGYDRGFFDKALDEDAKVHRYYLRIPAYATNGDLDAPKTRIELGKPFILKHEVLTGIDPNAEGGLATSLVNQFSTPIPTEDHPIADHWIRQSRSILNHVEQALLQ